MILLLLLNMLLSTDLSARNITEYVVKNDLRSSGYNVEDVKKAAPDFYNDYYNIVRIEVEQAFSQNSGSFGEPLIESANNKKKLLQNLAKIQAPSQAVIDNYHKELNESAIREQNFFIEEFKKEPIVVKGEKIQSIEEPQETPKASTQEPPRSIVRIVHRYKNGKIFVEYVTSNISDDTRKRLLIEWGAIFGIYIAYIRGYAETYKNGKTEEEKSITLNSIKNSYTNYRAKRQEFLQCADLWLGSDDAASQGGHDPELIKIVNASDWIMDHTVKDFVK